MEWIIIIILLAINGIFAMYEIAMVSSRTARLEDRASKGEAGAQRALKLQKEPEKLFSAIQTGITLIGIVTGAYSGVSFADDLTPIIAQIDALQEQAYSIAFVIVITGVTYFSLVFGELIPKSIALAHPESIAIRLSPFMRHVSTILYPIVWFLATTTKGMMKLFGFKQQNQPGITEEELIVMLKLGAETGVLHRDESKMMKEVLRFGDKNASQMMTQRLDVIHADVQADAKSIVELATRENISRILITDKSIDQIIGYISISSIYKAATENGSPDIRKLVSTPLFIPERMPALKVMETFKKTKNHFGVVIDEYGAVAGIITLHDLIESIVGDLPQTDDEHEADIIQREDGSWLAEGSMLIDELTESLQIVIPDDEMKIMSGINTVGGYVMNKLNRIPRAGEWFIAFGCRFEVMDMDGHRVDKVLISKPK